MSDYTLFVIRGLPGSGKTWLARAVAKTENAHSADDFFYNDEGVYDFDARKLTEAHDACKANVERDLQNFVPRVAVHNTCSRYWEIEAYEKMAKKYGYTLFVVECQNDFGSTHFVPRESVDRMIERWERPF